MLGFCDRFYSFGPGEALYTDHLGRRIVADYEGSGTAVIASRNGLLWLEHSEGVIEITPGDYSSIDFRDFGLIVAEPDAQVQVWIGTNEVIMMAPKHLAAPPGSVGTAVAKTGLQVNQNCESLQVELPPQIITFWNGATGDDLELMVSESLHSRLLLSFQLSDAELLKSIEWRVQNMSELELLESAFSDGTPRSALCASHLIAAHFSVQIPLNPKALILRKVYDRFHGRQRARVMVDGEVCGMWYEPVQDRQNRWGIGDFVIDGKLIRNKSEVAITIDPPSGTPLWSVSQLEVWAIEETPLSERAELPTTERYRELMRQPEF